MENGSVFAEGTVYSFEKNITLTAVYEESESAIFTVTLNNQTAANFTAWADGEADAKTVYVEYGGTLTIPAIKWDSYSKNAKDSDDYEFLGWFYKDKNEQERKFDQSVEFTYSNLNIDEKELTVYAKVQEVLWIGPF